MSSGFDDAKYHALATQGQVGGLALDVAIGFQTIAFALAKLGDASGVDIKSEVAAIHKVRDEVWGRFEGLTGWKA
jgi:hypothetical protein